MVHGPGLREFALDRVIEISGLSKRFGPVRALTNLTMTLSEGVTGLLGPNGAGKTTLLRILLGLVRPDSGTAFVLGLDVTRLSRRVRRRVGYMPEDDCHIGQLSAVEYVAFCGQLEGLPATAAKQRAHSALDYVGMDEERYRLVNTYSLGMRQRIKLAQALVGGPELVLLDEPTTGMDPSGRSRMLRLVTDLGARGVNVVFSSHLLGDVEQVCRQVVVMDEGRLTLSGPLQELRQADEAACVLKVRGDLDRFAAEVVSHGCEVTSRYSETFHVRGSSEAVIAAAAAAGVQLRGLQPRRRSLQDVFLEAVHKREDESP